MESQVSSLDALMEGAEDLFHILHHDSYHPPGCSSHAAQLGVNASRRSVVRSLRMGAPAGKPVRPLRGVEVGSAASVC